MVRTKEMTDTVRSGNRPISPSSLHLHSIRIYVKKSNLGLNNIKSIPMPLPTVSIPFESFVVKVYLCLNRSLGKKYQRFTNLGDKFFLISSLKGNNVPC